MYGATYCPNMRVSLTRNYYTRQWTLLRQRDNAIMQNS